MANHQPKSDPFAKVALIAGLALILLTVLILINFLINTIQKNSIDGEIDTSAIIANKATLTAENIHSIGEVTTSDGAGAAPTATRSGEEVYKAICTACHDTGAANAPKIDDKAAWEPRVATGFDALMHSAINGKGAMPARGGQNVPDAELKATIAYMTTKAGFSLDIPKDEATAAASEATEEKPADIATEPKTEEAPAAAQPSTEAEKAEPKATAPTTEEPVSAPGAPSAPEAAKAPSTPTAPNAVVAPSTPEAPATNSETPAPSAAVENTAAAVATTAVVAAATETVAPATKSGINGEAIYKKTCFACHDMGIAGSPKLGDKAAWAPRIATGNDTIYQSAIKGKTSPTGAMPPKGGNMSLSDDEVKAAVDYMVSQSQ